MNVEGARQLNEKFDIMKHSEEKRLGWRVAMDYIHRLPFIFSSIITLVVGLIGYASRESFRRLYMKMAVCMVLAYLLGIALRSVINLTLREVDERNREKQEQEKKKEQEAEKDGQPVAGNAKQAEKSVPGIDIRVDDSHDEFTPLKISEIIKSSLKEDEKS